MNVFDLAATLTLDTSKYESGLNGAAGKAQMIGKKIGSAMKTATLVMGALAAAGTAVAGAFVGAAKKTAAYGDQVDKMSQKLGLSTDAYQKWDYVIQLAGADINSMTTGLKTLTNKIDDAKNGGEGAQQMFEKLGISMDDLSKMSREEVFEATIKGFQGMADSTERAALANDLFGKSGQNLTPLFNQSQEDTQKQLELAEKYGMVMPEAAVKASAAFVDSTTTMQMTFTGLKNRMMGEFLPAMTQVTDGLGKLFAGDESGADDIAKGIEGIVQKTGEVLPKVLEIGGKIAKNLAKGVLKNLPQLAVDMGKTVLDIGGKILPQLPKIIEDISNKLVELAPTIAEGGAEMIIQLGKGLIDNLPTIISAAGQIVNALLRVFIGIPAILLAKGMGAVGSFVLGLLKKANSVATAGQKLVSNAVKGLKNLPAQFLSWAGRGVISLVSAFSRGAGKVIAGAKKLASGAINAIKSGFGNVVSIGSDIVRGIGRGITNGIGWIKNQISSFVGNVKSFLKRLFKIGSPSKWARDEIGKMIDAGLANGIRDNADMVDDAMGDVVPDISSGEFATTKSVAGNGGLKQVIQNITAPVTVNGAEDPETWADRFVSEFEMRARMA